jgi:hypothetical protein
MKEGYILSFKSTHDAFTCQKQLQESEVAFKVIPTPVEITANCGISLYLEIIDIGAIQAILKDMSDIIYVKAKIVKTQIKPVGF